MTPCAGDQVLQGHRCDPESEFARRTIAFGVLLEDASCWTVVPLRKISRSRIAEYVGARHLSRPALVCGWNRGTHAMHDADSAWTHAGRNGVVFAATP